MNKRLISFSKSLTEQQGGPNAPAYIELCLLDLSTVLKNTCSPKAQTTLYLSSLVLDNFNTVVSHKG